MKVVQINTTCGSGSTGKICIAVSKLLTSRNVENYILYTSGHSDYSCGIKYAGDYYKKLQALKSRVLGNGGFNSHIATKRLIYNLERIQPDIVHIHNIHSHDCNLNMLFRYLKKKSIKLYWTFHDAWAFTANCPYFVSVQCNKWKTECFDCPQIHQTSWFVDRSRKYFNKKKQLFTGLNLTIITPSKWMANLVQESFLKNYPVKVVNNGIDLETFKPTQDDINQRYRITSEQSEGYLILGVAQVWGNAKGLDVFVELSKRLDNQYQIVLVGTDAKVDKILPKNIFSIHRTSSQKALAKIYTAADVFVNPTREENYPTVNMEALACGTPVITFRTGGSPETIDETCGIVVERDDVDALEREVRNVCENKVITRNSCIMKAKEFEERKRFEEYARLYGSTVAK